MRFAAVNRHEEPDHGDDVIVLSRMDRPIPRRRITAPRAAALAGAIALLGLTYLGYERYVAVRTLTVAADRLTVARVEQGMFREYVPVNGSIVPRSSVYLDAVEGGEVVEVHAEEGAAVSAGDPVVTLKNTQLQLQVIAAEAQLTEQLNQLGRTRLDMEQARLGNDRERVDVEYRIGSLRRELARLEPLSDTSVSRGRIEDLKAELAYQIERRDVLLAAQRVDEEFRATQLTRMRDALDAMNRNLALARDNLDSLVVTTPIAGQLTLLEAQVGESKLPGARVGQVDEQGAFKVTAYVDEFYLPRVAIDQRATFESGGRRYGAAVSKIYPDVRDRQFQVDFELLGAGDAPFRRGQTVRMQLEIGMPAETLVLANGPFYDDTGGEWAFVLNASETEALRRSVQFGRRNPDRIEVVGGLRAGDAVITSSYENLIGYERIRLGGSS